MLKPLSNAPYLLLTLAVLFWAGNFILGRAFHADIPPVALAFWRWLCAALLIVGPAWKHLHNDRRTIAAHWPIILLLSTLGIAAFNTLAYSGLQYTQALNAFLIQSLMPVFIVALSFLCYRERVTSRQIGGILVSLLGAFTIITRGQVATLLSLDINRGDLLVCTAIICYAGYSVALRKRPPIHPLSLIATTFMIGTALLLPIYLWEHSHVRVIRPDATTLAVIAYVAIFPSILSYLCFNRGVELIGANQAGLFIHLMPVFGSVMAMVFLGEQFMLFHAIGILLIATGIFLATRARPE